MAEACSAWGCLDIAGYMLYELRSFLFLLRCAFKMLPLSLGWCKLPGRGHLFPWWLWWKYLQLQVLECCSGSALLQASKYAKGFCKECVASRSYASCWRVVFTGCQSVVGFTSMGDKLAVDSSGVPSSLTQLLREQIWARSTCGVGICSELLSRSAVPISLLVKDGDGLAGATHIPTGVLSAPNASHPNVICLYEDCVFPFWMSQSEEQFIFLQPWTFAFVSLDCKHCM